MVAEDDGTVDKDNIKVEKKVGGSIHDSEIIEGVLIDKERVHPAMPKKVADAKILLLNAPVEFKKTEVDAEINITSPDQLQAFLDEEERMIRSIVEKIVASGANVLFCQKGIDDIAQHYLAKAGVFALRRVKKSDMEKLARATGASLVSSIDAITAEELGFAGSVEEKKLAGEEMTYVTGCKNPKAVTILVRGGTEHVVDELNRALEDAIRVVSVVIEDGKFVAGGGSPEIELSLRLKDYAASVGGRAQLAIEAFATALEIIPRTLAENAGLDPIDMLVEPPCRAREGRQDRRPRRLRGPPRRHAGGRRDRAPARQDPGHLLRSRGRRHDPQDRRRHRRVQVGSPPGRRDGRHGRYARRHGRYGRHGRHGLLKSGPAYPSSPFVFQQSLFRKNSGPGALLLAPTGRLKRTPQKNAPSAASHRRTPAETRSAAGPRRSRAASPSHGDANTSTTSAMTATPTPPRYAARTFGS